MSEPVISVRGEAVLEVEPEIARLSVRVESKDPDRRKVLDRLTARNAECLDLIKSYGDAVERIETSRISVVPVLKYRRRDENVQHYQGSAWIRLTVGDFAVLGELVTRLANLELTTVDGPYWELRPSSDVHRRAREQAVHEALNRARAYAEALGCRLTGLVELADSGMSPHDSMRPQATRYAMMASAQSAGGEPQPIDLEPETQVVSATVEARFTASAPESL
jgi:hypothetical protein